MNMNYINKCIIVELRNCDRLLRLLVAKCAKITNQPKNIRNNKRFMVHNINN